MNDDEMNDFLNNYANICRVYGTQYEEAMQSIDQVK